MVGYPLVLPDMIGGNGYGDEGLDGPSNMPSKEIFLRWLQANTFMPALQFSYVPWDYDSEVRIAVILIRDSQPVCRDVLNDLASYDLKLLRKQFVLFD